MIFWDLCSISLNTWHHIAVTYDGTTLAIYVDGVLDASALKSLGTIDSVFSMGKAISGGWTPFKGLIDEVELFDRALSEAEIRAIFEAGSAGEEEARWHRTTGRNGKLVARDGNASDIVDGNPGTIVGGATFTDGLVGQAFSFDAGLSSGITVPNSANLNPAEAITIDAWIKPTSFPNAFPTVVRKRASDSQYSLTVTDQGQVRCKLDSLVKTPRPPWAMGG